MLGQDYAVSVQHRLITHDFILRHMFNKNRVTDTVTNGEIYCQSITKSHEFNTVQEKNQITIYI